MGSSFNLFLLVALPMYLTACGADDPFARGKQEPSAMQSGNSSNGVQVDDCVSAPDNSRVACKGVFEVTIYPDLRKDCAGCHGQNGPAATYDKALTLIAPGNLIGSKLYQKAIGELNHGGGAKWTVDSDEAQRLATWIVGH